MKLIQTICSWILEGYPRNVFSGKKLHFDVSTGMIKNDQGQNVDPANVIWFRNFKTVVQCVTNFSEQPDENSILYYADEEVISYLEST